jgi:hypothetical protein
VQQLAVLLPLLLRDKLLQLLAMKRITFPSSYLSKRKTLGSPKNTTTPRVAGRLSETNMDTRWSSAGFPGVHNLGYQKIQIQRTLGPAQITPGFMGGY